MILLIAVAGGLLATLLRARLTGRQLHIIQLKHSWLVFVAVIPQVILFQIPALGRQVPDLLASFVLISSQALLLFFAIINISQPGVGLLGIGLGANLVAIVFNGGWMPISPDTVHIILPSLPVELPLEGQRLGLSKDWILAEKNMIFPWLSDRLTLPGWIPYRVAFSIGDILIAIGAFLLLWSLSNPEQRRQNGFS